MSGEARSVVSNFAMVLEKAFNPYDDKSIRVPFYLTSSYRKRLGVPGVSMVVNPSSVSFRQAKRTTQRDTQGGKVYYHWANQLGRNNDVLEMDFVGTTGNLNLQNGTIATTAVGGNNIFGGATDWLNEKAAATTDAQDDNPASVRLQGSGYSVSSAKKLANFMNLYSLTREPMTDPKTGAPVLYYIAYSSPLFGNTFVNFIGHFNRVMDITDDASDPFRKSYSFGFTAIASTPSMDYVYSTVVNNLKSIFSNPI